MTQSDPMDGKSHDGEMRGLLHEFNQPLTAIGNYAQAGCHLIDSGQADPARLKELFEKITRQSTRAITLSQELSQALGKASGRS